MALQTVMTNPDTQLPQSFDRHTTTRTIASTTVAANLINLSTSYRKSHFQPVQNLSTFPVKAINEVRTGEVCC
jgi:hypothetical protein